MPQADTTQHQDGIPLFKSSPLQEKENELSDQLPQPFKELRNGPVSVYHTKRQAKLRPLKMVRNKEGGLELPV